MTHGGEPLPWRNVDVIGPMSLGRTRCGGLAQYPHTA